MGVTGLLSWHVGIGVCGEVCPKIHFFLMNHEVTKDNYNILLFWTPWGLSCPFACLSTAVNSVTCMYSSTQLNKWKVRANVRIKFLSNVLTRNN